MQDIPAQSDKHTAPADKQALANDLVWGADAIAQVIGVNREKVYYLMRTGRIPVSRINPRTLVASRRKLQKWAAEFLAV
jgi:hypothetical protein